MSKNLTPVNTTIRKCARCGEDHEDITFRAMSNPFDSEYPYWALCPNGYGPILLSSVVVDDE